MHVFLWQEEEGKSEHRLLEERERIEKEKDYLGSNIGVG